VCILHTGLELRYSLCAHVGVCCCSVTAVDNASSSQDALFCINLVVRESSTRQIMYQIANSKSTVHIAWCV
jgi:hypothetical protein